MSSLVLNALYLLPITLPHILGGSFYHSHSVDRIRQALRSKGQQILELGFEPSSISRDPVLPFKINSYVIFHTQTIIYIGGYQGLGEGS